MQNLRDKVKPIPIGPRLGRVNNDKAPEPDAM
jgi:hypothetical protein